MTLEKAHEPLEGETKFPHIDIPISREDLMELREYILVSSEAFDQQSITDQLKIDFNLFGFNKYVATTLSENKTINPYKVAIALEQENLQTGTSLHFFDLLENAYEVDQTIKKIYDSEDEGSKKFAIDLDELFSDAPIMKSLVAELSRLQMMAEDNQNRNNPSLPDEIKIRSLSRAIMIQQAVLVAIHYH